MQQRPRIGITLGDPAGIGPEIVLRALQDPEIYRDAVPVLFGNPRVVRRALTVLGSDAELRLVASAADAAGTPGVLDLVATCDDTPPPWGQVSASGGREAGQAITAAVGAVQAGTVDGLNTAPLNKEALRLGGYAYPGHTEMLADLFESSGVYTLFVTGSLYIFFLTRHHPLRTVPGLLSVETVYAGIVRCLTFLNELGFADSHLAVAALNPHAGEHGLLGSEEQAILEPAVARAQAEGYAVSGPVPADAVFYQAREGRFTGVLSLYHDQGHIAAKTLDFYGTVSVTLGLPVIRTSVDHGTAFDIAGRGIADARGQVAALRAAARLTRQQQAARRDPPEP